MPTRTSFINMLFQNRCTVFLGIEEFTRLFIFLDKSYVHLKYTKKSTPKKPGYVFLNIFLNIFLHFWKATFFLRIFFSGLKYLKHTQTFFKFFSIKKRGKRTPKNIQIFWGYFLCVYIPIYLKGDS